ncbi:peptidyl-prolyl cis-trans isomerase [Phenylobacterium sp. LjRoot219]|uniref:peptidyl-prolyl cis-trans isomerase n=1 Tax=Phenylobacterium sp. LjRoot219 TaxID=3342283 RepID=UPI003ECFE2E1
MDADALARTSAKTAKAPAPRADRRWRAARRALREPLLHFLLIGLVLFAAAEHHRRQTDHYRIVVTPQQVRQLAAAYQVEYGAEPTAAALAQLVDLYIDEEVLYREGLARKLDQDDPIVRRRIVQKVQFLQQDVAMPRPPTEAEAGAYYQAHRARYAAPAAVSFSHVFFADNAEGAAAARRRAEATLAQLPAATVRAPERGDSFPDLYDFASLNQEQVARLFGDSEFSRRLFEAPAGRWVGPLRSAYGWHLVRVQAAEPARQLPLETVRDRVRADLTIAEQEAANRQSFERLKARFTVVREDTGARP